MYAPNGCTPEGIAEFQRRTFSIMSRPAACISIVTFNSSRYIERCLQTVLIQRDIDLDIVVVDNASTDGTLEILAKFGNRIRLIANPTNAGFAAAQNQGIRSSTAEW